MRNGHVLDSIQVNGQRFGKIAPTVNRINLAQNEKVTAISYNTDSHLNQHCNLSIITNVRHYGPFVTQGPVCNKFNGSKNVVTQYIQDSQQGFLDFLINHTGRHADGQVTFSD